MRPLCVDLDGTLIKTDLLLETSLQHLKSNPKSILELLLYVKNKPKLKEYLAGKVDISPEDLPYNKKLLEFLKSQEGRQLILVTGSHEKYAKKVADHLGFFESFYGTTANLNLTGKRKRDFLIEKFGAKGFDYIGNSSEDVHVWKESHESFSVVEKRWPVSGIQYLVSKERSPLTILLKLLRVHQWSKNALVFLPLLLAHKREVSDWIEAGLAFLSFCAIASSVYILNDILDIENDRKHPTKRFRPIPSGEISLLLCGTVFITLVGLSFLSVSFISQPYAFLFPLFYLLLNVLYSSYLKKLLIIDIVVLTSFYLIRILFGSFATQTFTSQWLLSFSFFTFFSLAIIKRYTEVLTLFNKQGRKSSSGRAYIFDDLPVLLNLGVASGVAATIVLSLYLQFGVQEMNYPSPEFLWIIPTLFILWISNIWIRASRGKVDDDPVKFALKDRFSLIVFFLVVSCAIKASL